MVFTPVRCLTAQISDDLLQQNAPRIGSRRESSLPVAAPPAGATAAASMAALAFTSVCSGTRVADGRRRQREQACCRLAATRTARARLGLHRSQHASERLPRLSHAELPAVRRLDLRRATIGTHPVCARDTGGTLHHWARSRCHPDGRRGAVDPQGRRRPRRCNNLCGGCQHALRCRREALPLPVHHRSDACRPDSGADAAGASALFRDGLALERNVFDRQFSASICARRCTSLV